MEDLTLQEKRKKTDLVLANIYNLPGRSEVMDEIFRTFENPNSTSSQISKLICKDQAIATKILSIANSPLYGLRRKVSTIDFAILVIGLSELKKILIGLSIMESFKNKTDKYLDQKNFWIHSMMTANASKRLAEDLGYKNPGEAFISGFLHDLGIPVIHKYFHTAFIEIFETVSQKGSVTSLDEEIRILGYDHQQIGGFLAERWNLPALLCDSIAHHHKPSEAKLDRELAAIVHLADYMTQKHQLGHFYWDESAEFDSEELATLKLKDKNELEALTGKYESLFKEELASMKF